MSHARGIPSALDALLFMFGAVSGFALIAIVSHGGLRGHFETAGMNVAVWHGFHFVSIATAIGGAAAITHLTHTRADWPLDGFAATSIYLLGVAALLAIAPADQPRGGPPTDDS